MTPFTEEKLKSLTRLQQELWVDSIKRLIEAKNLKEALNVFNGSATEEQFLLYETNYAEIALEGFDHKHKWFPDISGAISNARKYLLDRLYREKELSIGYAGSCVEKGKRLRSLDAKWSALTAALCSVRIWKNSGVRRRIIFLLAETHAKRSREKSYQETALALFLTVSYIEKCVKRKSKGAL